MLPIGRRFWQEKHLGRNEMRSLYGTFSLYSVKIRIFRMSMIMTVRRVTFFAGLTDTSRRFWPCQNINASRRSIALFIPAPVKSILSFDQQSRHSTGYQV